MSLPLEKIRVVEFTHAVMGPSAGLIMGDMGADVIHVESVEGDQYAVAQRVRTRIFFLL
jgi:crotonobetainyl-CoA:carnitine CoA-transferase CaiB-like acyl-CoA transferase